MKQNILMIMCDQLRYDCIVGDYVKTPNIDRIRSGGLCFDQAYSQTPVCIPARHSLISGQDAFSLGLVENASTRGAVRYPLAKLVRDQGYYTCVVGKMHFIPTREHFGFDHMFLSEEIPEHVMDDEYLQFLRSAGYTDVDEPHGKRSADYYVPQDSVLPERFHTTGWTADQTVEVLKNNRNRPFFLFSSFIKPHPPFDPCEPYNHMYEPETVPEPIPDMDKQIFDWAIPFQNSYKVNGFENVTPEQLHKIRAYYYGSITQMDTAVGRILDALDQYGLDKNTVIIFTSDHGEMLGDHRAFGKRSYYESSCKIPLLLKLPGEPPADTHTDALAILPDIYATILDIAGVSRPDLCTGKSLLDIYKGRQKSVHPSIIAQYGGGPSFKAMVRWEHYKYIYFANGPREVLYNLEKDPLEQTPLTDLRLFEKCREQLKSYFKEKEFMDAFNADGELIAVEYAKPPCIGFIDQSPYWPETVLE